MDNRERLYEMMDWARIEGLVYSEEDQPFEILGPHVTSEGVLIQAFLPTACQMDVLDDTSGKTWPMELEEEPGFFAALLPGKKIPSYRLRVRFDDDSESTLYDPYAFEPQIWDGRSEIRFNAGIAYQLYDLLGAHPASINGVDGVYFAVWAPNALRVSLVGDFNLWDGRRLPMRRRNECGVFELFVPQLEPGTLYKYEIKTKNGATFLKADPFARQGQLRPENASIIADLSAFKWSDDEWIRQRAVSKSQNSPMSVLEVDLGSFKKPSDGGLFCNCRELAGEISAYVRERGYTHILLLPVMEYPLDESLGFQTSGYFAPTARYGTPADFMYFVNYLHREGIGVLLSWAPSQFPTDAFALGGFDGTCLYEHLDPRQGKSAANDTFLYNYGRPQVTNFLIASALFWLKVYHADGLCVDGVARMLYLDYDKSDGQWIANMYGGNENLEAIAFLRQLTNTVHRLAGDTILIAQDDSSWPKVTAPEAEDGLGFDYKWNTGWMNDFISYMQLDPIFRGHHHYDLTLSMVYNYCENFLLPLPHQEMMYGKGSMYQKMPGRREMKFANLRAAYGYFMTHPGKKLLFMGQDFGQKKEWAVGEELSWAERSNEDNAGLSSCVRSLLELYRSQPALYELDSDPDGFEWINSISANENMLVFLRKGREEKDMLLVICNFSALSYENRKIGVPFHGKYKEIFSTDKKEFGGQGQTNPRVKISRIDECDGREDSIRVTVPAMGVSVYSCQKVDLPDSDNEKAMKTRKTRASSAVSTALQEALKTMKQSVSQGE